LRLENHNRILATEVALFDGSGGGESFNAELHT